MLKSLTPLVVLFLCVVLGVFFDRPVTTGIERGLLLNVQNNEVVIGGTKAAQDVVVKRVPRHIAVVKLESGETVEAETTGEATAMQNETVLVCKKTFRLTRRVQYELHTSSRDCAA